jgi:hypothetical protein
MIKQSKKEISTMEILMKDKFNTYRIFFFSLLAGFTVSTHASEDLQTSPIPPSQKPLLQCSRDIKCEILSFLPEEDLKSYRLINRKENKTFTHYVKRFLNSEKKAFEFFKKDPPSWLLLTLYKIDPKEMIEHALQFLQTEYFTENFLKSLYQIEQEFSSDKDQQPPIQFWALSEIAQYTKQAKDYPVEKLANILHAIPVKELLENKDTTLTKLKSNLDQTIQNHYSQGVINQDTGALYQTLRLLNILDKLPNSDPESLAKARINIVKEIIDVARDNVQSRLDKARFYPLAADSINQSMAVLKTFQYPEEEKLGWVIEMNRLAAQHTTNSKRAEYFQEIVSNLKK